MDPISAVAGAVSSMFDTFGVALNVIGYGRRAEYDRLPGWITPDQVQQKDYTAEIVLIVGTLLLIFIILMIVKRK